MNASRAGERLLELVRTAARTCRLTSPRPTRVAPLFMAEASIRAEPTGGRRTG